MGVDRPAMRFFSPTLLAAALLFPAGLPASSRAADALSALASTPIIRSWGTEAGLPQNSVTAIAQTRDGYMWLGTHDGLVRFDGVRFKVYGLEQGLPGLNINQLLVDGQDVLWIGTDGAGLACLREGRISSVADASDFPGTATITSLETDGAGRLWVGTDGGLRFCRDGQLVAPDPALDPLLRRPISFLQRSRDGRTMRISTHDFGLQTYRDGRLTDLPGPSEEPLITTHSLLEDRQGRLWASIGNGRLVRRNGDGWQIFRETNGLPFAYVSCMAQDAAGTIWAGSLDAGLYRFDGENFQALHTSDGLSADDINCLHCDSQNNLWVGTRTGGLDRLSRRSVLSVAAAQGLTNDYTRGVAEAADGSFWVGTIGGSIYRGTPDTGFTPFRPDDCGNLIYYYSSRVGPVLARPDGSLWWGGGRASLFEWQNGRLANLFTNEPWQQNVLVTALADDHRGGLWIGGTRGRLVHYRDGRFTVFPRPTARASITALAVQADGSLWIGSVAGGLKYISAAGDTVTTLGLARLSVRTLYLDPDEVLWIGSAGSAGGGLSCWRHGRLTCFTAGQGLNLRTVSQIVEDNNGNLWLGCNSGIYKVSKRNLLACADGTQPFVHLRSYGLNDGMLAEECSGEFSPAGLKTRAGMICMPTVKGLVFINPDDQRRETPPPRALIEEISVNKHQFTPEDWRVPGEPPAGTPPPVPRLIIAAGNHDLEIRYTAIDYSAPEKIGFRYRMDGLDTGWQEALNRRSAPYHLPPGLYTFHVQACNAAGVWHDEDTALALVMLPFFWETSWFRGTCLLAAVLLFCGCTWWELRRRYRLRLERLQTLNAIERERLRISQDMHDHVGGMLTQVSQLSDLMLGETGDQELVRHRVERIGDRARAAVQAMDEIVWATNPKNDNLASFAEYVSRYSDEFFEYTRIRCWQEIPATLPALPLRADVRHNVFLAVREAFNNTLKHSHCTEVWLRLKLDGELVTIEVDDNGVGFSPGQTPAGNGLENFRARLAGEGGRAELISTPGKGTRVRFIFPLTP